MCTSHAMGTICTLIPFLVAVDSLSSTLDDHILYFDEWRLDWDHLNDFDNDYHRDWAHLIAQPGAHNGYGCTHDLTTIGKKLCVLETTAGDYLFKFKDSNTRQQHHSPMVSAARELSNYYDNILLHFDDDSDWSSIESIDGANGYEAVRKCQPFTFTELCAIYNPFADNLNVHIKVAHSTAPRHGASRSSSHRIDDNLFGDNTFDELQGDQLSIDEAISLLMDDYDDTLGYSYWRGNALGFQDFDQKHEGQWGEYENGDSQQMEEEYGAYTHYFNTLSFDWDDSRDWVSFSKQTEMHPVGAKTEEVGAHPAKLEEVGAHPSKLEMHKIGASSKILSPSRSYTKCTGAIPLVHKHACVTMAGSNVRVHLADATEDELNILYNGLDDMFEEMSAADTNEATSAAMDIDSEHYEYGDYAYSDDAQYDYDYGYDEYADRGDDGGYYRNYDSRRRILSAMSKVDDLRLNFNDDNQWDEIVHSYSFGGGDADNFGRFGEQRSQHDTSTSSAVAEVMDTLDRDQFEPKFMSRITPHLYPTVKKCVHSKVMRMCIKLDVQHKKAKLHLHIPRFHPILRCLKFPALCRSYPRPLGGGKGIFNGIKRGMILERMIGRRNAYNRKRKSIRIAMKQIRVIRKKLNKLMKQLRKLKFSAAHDLNDNIYNEDNGGTSYPDPPPYPPKHPSWMPLWMWQDVQSGQQQEQSAANQEEMDDYDYYGDDGYYDQYYDGYYGDEDSINYDEDADAAENESDDDLKGDSWIEMNELATHDFDDEWENDEHWDEVTEVKTWEGTSIRRKCLHLWKHRLCLCQFLGWMDTNKYQCIYHHRTYHTLSMPSPSVSVVRPSTVHVHQKVNHVKGHESDTKAAPNVIYHVHHHDYNPTMIGPRSRGRHVMNINHLPIVWHNQAAIHNVIDEPEVHRRTDVVDKSVQHHFHHVVDQTVQHHVHDIVHHPIHEDIHHVIHHPIRQDVYHTVEHYPDTADHPQYVEEHVAGEGPQVLHSIRTAQIHHVDDRRHPNVVQHHFKEVPDNYNDGAVEREQREKKKNHVFLDHFAGKRGKSESESESGDKVSGHAIANMMHVLKKRNEELKQREAKEKAREKKFQKILWSDRHSHKMWELMKTHKPVYGKTATGRHMIVAQHINPKGQPMMISMHKHMPENRPQWMPQGLFTNLRHRGYYMVHSHRAGDHSTVTSDEDRWPHGSDLVARAGAKVGEYDIYDNYYVDDDFEDEDNADDIANDDEYFFNSELNGLVDFDQIYDSLNVESDEDEMLETDFVDEFMDDLDEWVITDIVNSLETAYDELFGDGAEQKEDQYWDSIEDLTTAKGHGVVKKCMNVMGRQSCLCGYGQHHFHCHKKQQYRRRYYLDTVMPKESPQWMSAHDFEWLKDQRLNAFTELLPDPLMTHLEFNQLFTIPYKALKQLVSPAVKMEHIEWHKDDGASSAHSMNAGDDYNYYGAADWYSDDYNSYDGYTNEYGDYVIDDFYNEYDGTHWVVTNEWTNDLNDAVFSAGTAPATTSAGQVLSTKCMMVFGREVCLCDFVNWVYDQSGTNPLYRCYSSGGSSLQPPPGTAAAATAAAAGVGANAQAQELKTLTAMKQQVAATRQRLNQILGKAADTGVGKGVSKVVGAVKSIFTGNKDKASGTNAAKPAARVDPRATPQLGWGSKIADYGYGDDDNQGFYEYDQYYTGGDGEAQQYGVEDDNDGDAVDIMPSFWTEGDGFSQTVFIGINTFWGLMMLSVFFGMMSCTVVCAVLNFEKMFCRKGYFKFKRPQYYDWKGIQTDYRSDGLYTIDEDGKSRHHEKDPGAGWVSGSADEEQFVK